ncbi:PAS domain S-box protein [Croceicoccus ponticola]|uniref:histidine kinase n=1 Tax=Croceicoccus ponticola TaxID=2217664 RepID=A0A437GYS6_9SPHN|nr:PAS domain S-box protein [Croceicoccus ponticola]
MLDLQPFDDRSPDHLRLVLETSQIGIWELDIHSGKAVRNETHDRIFGYSEPLLEWTYDRFLEHVVDADRSRVDELQKSAIEENREWSFECQIRTAEDRIGWIKGAGRPLQDANGNVVRLIGHVIDISDLKQNEARLRLITDELNHRVRNMLALIKSMVRLSARGATDISSFTQALEDRVGALARSHQLLTGDYSASLKPSAILEAELSALSGFEDQVRMSVNGETHLAASAGQGLALVFHELLTNATKHGALSNDVGHVEVVFEQDADAVVIAWQERGGPPVDQERGSGFGSLLILNALAADGTVEQIFSPDGLECRIMLDVK